MAILEASNISFNYSDKELYQSINFKLNPKEHAVLVGPNGAGKSTFLNILIGKIRPDKGSVYVQNGLKLGYLDQKLDVDNSLTLSEYLYGVYAPLYSKEVEMQKLYEEASTGPSNYEKLLNRASKIAIELEESGFYKLESKVHNIISSFGLTTYLSYPLAKLSSGQKEKAYLAKMLLEERDILLLDEPTNFLDVSQVKSLIELLKNYSKAFLVVSHDEGFLMEIADVVFALEGGRLTRYKGDYLHYLEQSEIDKAQYENDYKAQQRYIKKEETFIAKHIVRATSAKAAKSHRKRLEALDRLEAPTKEAKGAHFSFPFSFIPGEEMLKVEDLVIGYESPLLAPISFILRKDQKLAILGHNGVGKTTLLKTLLSEIPSLGGHFNFLPGVKYAYFSQEEVLNKELSAYEAIAKEYPLLTKTEIRTLLGNVGLSKELSTRPLKELSGGEEAKARLALLSMEKSNMLILDEPTNHLDVKAKEALKEALINYPGPIILVSHEEEFYSDIIDYELRFN